jgi:drug/metabolite transporter (DMT)-like permease
MELCVLSSSGILVIVNSKIISWNLIKPHLIRAILMAAIICTAVFLFSSSLTYLSVIVVVTLGLLTKLIRLTYGYFILKERLNKTELIVLLLMVFGGMLASF